MASSDDQKDAHEHTVYKALEPLKKEIRILHISPSLSDGRIVGFLEIVSLEKDEELAYEALSWCWGPPSSGAERLLNGKVTTISLAARDTLYNLCILHKHFRVWMDAVCINQRDVSERSQQVAIMKDVYSRADRVLIWLGEEDESSATAAE
ncbi:Heterokaryon incompatibility protein 6, OR allele [Pseudocercospora fuligena]|uniref:Heterokaryon incompatibility protein 6, OR allele n=1 Tax=Pseudocercospora fuligena TaxID=685502 RepID=A0A8H6RAG4_9PEZI|nr:Heterokaryon incompatibility protein 6, OR allele [Pseudocercospora fuligena]